MRSLRRKTRYSGGKNIVYVTNAPAPYKTGMLDAISETAGDFTAIYLVSREYMRSWESPLSNAAHSYVQLDALKLDFKAIETSQYVSLKLFFEVFSRHPAAVVIGPYSQFVFMALFVLCKLRNIPVVIWYESHEGSSISPSYLKKLGGTVKKTMLRMASAVVVPGALALDNARKLGVKEDRIFIAPHSVDNEVYSSPALAPMSPNLSFILSKIENYDRVLLYVGQFVSRKNLKMLAECFIELKHELGSCALLLVGGKDDELPIDCDVITAGFIQSHEINSIYHACDGLVLPSTHEVWGLVVNEGAAAGLPVIVSTQCGASEIALHTKGYTFDARSKNSLKRALLDWRQGAEQHCRKATREKLVCKYSFKEMASAFQAALDFSMSTSSPLTQNTKVKK